MSGMIHLPCRSRSVCVLCPAREHGLEQCDLLRLLFLHRWLHEEISTLWSVTHLNSEMHTAGSFGERLNAVALAERVALLGRGGQGQQAILLKFRHELGFLALEP